MKRNDNVSIRVLRLRGELTLEDTLKIKNLLAEYIKAGFVHVALDLTAVIHLHLSGVPVLVERAHRLREYGGDLKIFGLSPYLNRIMDLSGMKGQIVTCQTEDDMLYAYGNNATLFTPKGRTA